MCPMSAAAEQDVLDYRMAKFSGATMRLYTGSLPATFSAVPTGTKLAEFVLPNPSHNASSYTSATNRYTAVMRGTWADQSADAAGTFGCYTVTDTSGAIIDRGTVGIAGSGAGLIVNAASIAAGANFSITEFTFEHGAAA